MKVLSGDEARRDGRDGGSDSNGGEEESISSGHLVVSWVGCLRWSGGFTPPEPATLSMLRSSVGALRRWSRYSRQPDRHPKHGEVAAGAGQNEENGRDATRSGVAQDLADEAGEENAHESKEEEENEEDRRLNRPGRDEGPALAARRERTGLLGRVRDALG